MEERYQAYDPFGEKGPTYYQPDNDAALHLLAIQLIIRDIGKLLNMGHKSQDNYERKLLSKYAIIEIISLDTEISELTGKIFSGKIEYPIKPDALSILQEKLKAYNTVKKKDFDKLKV